MIVKELISKLLNFDMNQEVMTYMVVDDGDIRPLDFYVGELKAYGTYAGIEIKDDCLAPIIRCVDCKHLTHSPHKWYCPKNKKVVDSNDFCSEGEWE